jgi:hypothetical protein
LGHFHRRGPRPAAAINFAALVAIACVGSLSVGCVNRGEATASAPTKNFSNASTCSIEVRSQAGNGHESVFADELRTMLLSQSVFDAVLPPGRADVAIVATITSLEGTGEAQGFLKQEATTTIDVFMVDKTTSSLLARFQVASDSKQQFSITVNGIPLHALDDRAKQALQNAAYVTTQQLKEARNAQGSRTKFDEKTYLASAAPAKDTYVDAAPAPVALDVDDMKGGLEMGLRAGYWAPLGIAIGSVNAQPSASGSSSSSSTAGDKNVSAPLSDTITGQIPIWADLGYRMNKNWYFGLYGSYGIGLVPTNVCQNNSTSCTLGDARFGGDVHFHFLPKNTVDPWLGLGFGYEVLGLTASAGSNSLHENLGGFEFVNLQAGADYKVNRGFGIGPTIMGSLAQYSNADVDLTILGKTASQSTSAFNKTFHGWLAFGLRGEFDIFIPALGAVPASAGKMGPTVVAVSSAGPGAYGSSASPTGGDAAANTTATSQPNASNGTTASNTPPNGSAPASNGTTASTTPPTVNGRTPPATQFVPTSVSQAPESAPLAQVQSQPPGAWPANVGIADRTQCTYRCTSNGVSVDSANLEKAVKKQLGAIRACANQSGEFKMVQSEAAFGPDGRLIFSLNSTGTRPAMQACISQIPAPTNVSGPPNQHWKCADYCQ